MTTSPQSKRDRRSARRTGCYVYGVFPGDIELNFDLDGVGDPPAKVGVVRSDDLAALVSPVDLSRPLGTPEDLRAHKQILDASAAEVPVLPMRFGAVLTDEDAVAAELLDANHDELTAALDELDGRAQYVVKGRYVEKAVLEEVVSENSEADRLRQQLRDTDPDATREARIELGQIISDAIAAKREADARTVEERMDGHCVAIAARELTHEHDAVNIAFLVDQGQEEELQAAADDLASQWQGRVEIRVLGPMAAYDFIIAEEPRG